MDADKKEITKDGIVYLSKGNLYKKSNLMITAKYKSTILENKILAIALARLSRAKENEHGLLTLEFTAAMLRDMIGDKSGTIYKKLQPVADHMRKTSFAYVNPETEEFSYYNLVDNAVYSKGVFKITFGSIVKTLTDNLQNQYTLLDLRKMVNFDNTYSFRLFEILSSQAYRDKYEKQTALYGFELYFSVAELKMELGVVDVDQKSVRSILDKSKHPDYDAALENAYKYKNLGDDVALFEGWREFKRRVLDVAINEINEKTELIVAYERERGGRGGKTTGVKFYVTTKDMMARATHKSQPQETVTESSGEKNIDDLIDDVREIITSEKISTKNARAILTAANNNIDLVREKYQLSLQSKSDINNLTGWLITAIKEDFTTSNINKTGKKNKFHNFDEREYNWDEIEKDIINTQKR